MKVRFLAIYHGSLVARIGWLITGFISLLIEVAWARDPFHCPPELDIDGGNIVWDSGYSDMPYMVVLPSGKIGMTLTISDAKEGNDDQHIVWLVSQDEGVTWTKPKPIEPPEGPEASWAMPFMRDRRLYVFYTYNTRNVRYWPFSDKDGGRKRVDMIGDLAVRYSDDEGVTWSERIEIPIPRTDIDLRNGFRGREVIFWLSGSPVRIGDYVYIGLSKGGSSYSGNILPESEAFLLRTKNIEDASSYELLPNGGHGFSAKAMNGDPITEEPSIASLGADNMLVTMRTTSGRILQASKTTDDAGNIVWQMSWAKHQDGRYLAHPRAKPMTTTLSNDETVLWFHNNSGTTFKNRNPVYLSCAIKRKGAELRWTQPHMLMCDSDREVRISYPSIVELGGGLVLIAETNKRTARVHRYQRDSLCNRN